MAIQMLSPQANKILRLPENSPRINRNAIRHTPAVVDEKRTFLDFLNPTKDELVMLNSTSPRVKPVNPIK
jgi:hypothetical protein